MWDLNLWRMGTKFLVRIKPDREEIEIMSLGKNSGGGSVLVLGRKDSEASRN